MRLGNAELNEVRKNTSPKIASLCAFHSLLQVGYEATSTTRLGAL